MINQNSKIKIQSYAESKRARLISVSGDVQGVSYRYFAGVEAKKLDLSGYVKNEHDGSVTIFVQGAESSVLQFVEWANEGSPMATVEDVDVAEVKVQENLTKFEVK